MIGAGRTLLVLGHRKVKVGGVLGAFALVALVPSPALAYQRPGTTERISVANDGTEAIIGAGEMVTISADARYVAFGSSSANLIYSDGNAFQDVFVRDRSSGVTERVSVAHNGMAPNGWSGSVDISADGRYLAFASQASNLIPSDTNEKRDLFVYDRVARVTERIATLGDIYTPPSISSDGRYVAFESGQANLVPGDTNGFLDVFVHDRATRQTERVSVATNGAEANSASSVGNLSDDGRYVAFQSVAFNLVPEDTNEASDVFVHDRVTGTTERVSVTSDGDQTTTHERGAAGFFGPESGAPILSGDGRYVAFFSSAANLVPGDTNRAADTFVHDRATGSTERVSVASNGAEVNNGGFSYFRPVGISDDGRLVAFSSPASNLVPGDTNGKWDIFVHDRATGSTERVSVATNGAEANDSASSLALSADGRYVAFGSYASNLIPNDTNKDPDVFVRDIGGSLGVVGALSVVPFQGGISVSGAATFSGTTVTQAVDPVDDGEEVGPVAADDLGAELTGAALIYRPELEDILLRLKLDSLPSVLGGHPGVVYGLELNSGGTSYEVRALRASASTPPELGPDFNPFVPSVPPYAAVYRCDPECVEATRLKGWFGGTRLEVTVSIPLTALGSGEGAQLGGLRVFTAAGEAITGSLVTVDELELPPSVIPASRVDLGIALASQPESKVPFNRTVHPEDGRFADSISTSGLPSGSYRVWARPCLGEVCGESVFQAVTL